MPIYVDMSLRILLLGSGGREHALAWKLAQSSLVDHIYVCPGNGGTIGEPKTTNLDSVPASDFPALVNWAVSNEVGTLTAFSIVWLILIPRSTLSYQDRSNHWLMVLRLFSVKVSRANTPQGDGC